MTDTISHITIRYKIKGAEMVKGYNDLSDVELYIIREYKSWAKSTCDVAYKLSMLEYWMRRAETGGVSRFVIK